MIKLETFYRRLLQKIRLAKHTQTLTLTRGPSTDHGTRGLLIVDGQMFHAFELPWKSNKANVSCIPTGSYNCIWHHSPRFGWVYKVLNVPNRTNILIHVGNWAGNEAKGFKSNTEGCILLGSKKGTDTYGQKTVWSSGAALKRFYSIMKKKPFKLVIKD